MYLSSKFNPMSKRTRTRKMRDDLNVPPLHKVAGIYLDKERNRLIVTTKNMLVNQLRRDGPKICRSFDTLTGDHIAACSEVFGAVSSMLIRHLPQLDDDGYKATCARLLSTASNAYIASIEVARHGFRRQYGVMVRIFLETLATIIVLAIRPTGLAEFHEGKLLSTKCVGWAKAALPPIGLYYGMLSEEFAHIGKAHAILEPPSVYRESDEALPFIVNTMRGDVWLLYVVAELIYHDELSTSRYWFGQGGGAVAYNPSDDERAWMGSFLGQGLEEEV